MVWGSTVALKKKLSGFENLKGRTMQLSLLKLSEKTPTISDRGKWDYSHINLVNQKS